MVPQEEVEMSAPKFRKIVIGELDNSDGPIPFNSLIMVGDINNDGLPDVVVSGCNGAMAWFENIDGGRHWNRHIFGDAVNLECGGSLVDLTGNGYPDLIVGNLGTGNELFWWENPGYPANREQKWVCRRLFRSSCNQFHDTIVGDVTGDGTLSLILTNQRCPKGTTIYRIPLPEDPRRSPWPNIEEVAKEKAEANPFRPEGMQPEEGLAIGDVDGDGRDELVAGTHWYKYRNGGWEEHKFAEGYISCKVAIGDIDGDGRNEIVLSEGDPCIYGQTEGGKLGWFKARSDIHAMWEEHRCDEKLLDAHSLVLHDLCGNGHLDILMGEIGMADRATGGYLNRPPLLAVYENDGKGGFSKRHVIDEGTGYHEAKLADIRGRGSMDVVTRPLHGPEKWKVHVYYRED
jgi:hypothetical protein